MRTVVAKVIILFSCFMIALKSNAQICQGTFGDPVVKEDFGSGTIAGAQLPKSLSTLPFTPANCPVIGQYSINSSIMGSANCQPAIWHNVNADHTGNPFGYMMIVNPPTIPVTFFTQAANGLCPNTTYQVSAYILNLLKPSAKVPLANQPDIVFTVKTKSGLVLANYITGHILPASSAQWNNYTVNFTTPANETDVVVTMTNSAVGGLNNAFILDDVTFRACGPVIEAGFGAANGPVTQNVCEGTVGAYILKSSATGVSNLAYQWQFSSDNQNWADIKGAEQDTYTVNFQVAAIGTYYYRLGAAISTNISSLSCRSYSQALTIDVTALPVTNVIPQQMICIGEPFQLEAKGGVSYIWYTPSLKQVLQNPLVINSAQQSDAGTYTCYVFSKSGCIGPPVKVLVKVGPTFTSSISEPVTICVGESTQLKASGAINYKWTPSDGLDRDDIANPVASPLKTTTYKVTIDNGGCVDSSRSVTVTVKQPPGASAGNNKFILRGESVKLNGAVKGDDVTYSWSPAANLDNPNSLTPIATPTDDITYTLTVTSPYCGIATSSVFVRVFQQITISNTFSPNNDGINDYWDIAALAAFPQCTVNVFNRYGQKVFESTGYPKPWDGKLNGVYLPQGTYYYSINLNNNSPVLSGWVLLVK